MKKPIRKSFEKSRPNNPVFGTHNYVNKNKYSLLLREREREGVFGKRRKEYRGTKTPERGMEKDQQNFSAPHLTKWNLS